MMRYWTDDKKSYIQRWILGLSVFLFLSSQDSGSSSVLSVPLAAPAVFSSASFAHYKRTCLSLWALLFPLQSEEMARAAAARPAAARRYAQKPWSGQDPSARRRGHYSLCRKVSGAKIQPWSAAGGYDAGIYDCL